VTIDPATPQEERLSDLLAACDEALAAGARPSSADYAELAPELRPRLERGLAGMRLLRQVLPRPRPTIASSAAPLPQTFGPFEVRRELGHGAFGTVYLAHDPHLRRDVALRVPRAEALLRPELRERFLREARAAAALEDDHIVAIYQVGEDHGVPFLAMQLLRGMNLEEWLRRSGPLAAADVLRLGHQMALGLAAAHERGLIHRDIKPSNLWLEPGPGAAVVSAATGRIKILDFGLARADQPEDHLTATGALLGTPAYMAPEQARGEHVGPRSDLFSLGVVLYRLATLKLPFTGKSRMAVLSALALDTPAAPDTVNADLPAGLSDLIMELLAKDPARRPASAQAVADRLQKLATAEAPPSSRNVPRGEAAGVKGQPAGSVVAARRRKRRPLAVAGVALAVLGPLAALGVGLVIRSDTPRKEEERTLPAETVPLDALRREDIPRYELAAAGGGDPAKAPPELVAVLGDSRLKHWASVQTVVYSPDNRLLASCGADCTIRLWDTESWKAVGTLTGHKKTVHGLSFSTDGKMLASGSDDGTVRIWDTATGKAMHVLPAHQPGGATGVAFRRDGKVLASNGRDHTVKKPETGSGHVFPRRNRKRSQVTFS
jgi:serine/threonine protein kinase